jgi:hypothetical protein
MLTEEMLMLLHSRKRSLLGGGGCSGIRGKGSSRNGSRGESDMSETGKGGEGEEVSFGKPAVEQDVGNV